MIVICLVGGIIYFRGCGHGEREREVRDRQTETETETEGQRQRDVPSTTACGAESCHTMCGYQWFSTHLRSNINNPGQHRIFLPKNGKKEKMAKKIQKGT